MKRTIITLALALTAISALACKRPTAHAIVEVGANYYLNDLKSIENGKENIGLTYALGVETPNRYNTFAVTGNYIFGRKYWSVGGEYRINPLGINWGYDTPINFAFTLGCGYRSTNAIYTNLGLELSGNMGTLLTWFASDKVGREFGLSNTPATWSNEFSLGFRLWIGRGW